MYNIVIVPSVPPINVEAEIVGSTWIALSWEQVLTSTVVVNQTVIISGNGTTHNMTVDGSQSNLNVTELMSGLVYTLRIIAVAEDGEMSFPSVTIRVMTLFPCKSVAVHDSTSYMVMYLLYYLQFLLVHLWTSR